ncbi:MAG: hypothetical protein ACRDDY_06030 [Clostridium sp.]|uniref:hypothetical protein n=1 Tax=Clostridium sp. TaxID=1506 RepID=UPI003EE7ED93
MFKRKKKIFSGLIVIIIFIVGSLASCDDAKKQVDGIQNNVNQGVDNSKKDIQNKSEASKSKNKNIQQFTSEDIGFDSNYVISELNKKGFDAKKITATEKPYDNFFSVPQELVQLNGGYISIYQYGIGDKQKMQNDYNTINEKGYIVSQNAGNWTLNFHLFEKGRVFVVYDGSDVNILTALNQIFGKQVQ